MSERLKSPHYTDKKGEAVEVSNPRTIRKVMVMTIGNTEPTTGRIVPESVLGAFKRGRAIANACLFQFSEQVYLPKDRPAAFDTAYAFIAGLGNVKRVQFSYRTKETLAHITWGAYEGAVQLVIAEATDSELVDLTGKPYALAPLNVVLYTFEYQKNLPPTKARLVNSELLQFNLD